MTELIGRRRLVHSSVSDLPIVGLSTNVFDAGLTDGMLDGIGTYTRALERALGELGVVTRRIGRPVRRGYRFIQPTNADLAFRLPLSVSVAMSAATKLATPFSAAIEREINVYHATDYLIPRLRRTPVIATIHDAIPLAHPEWGNRRLRRLKNHVLRVGAANADLVLAISNAAAEEIVEHYRIPRERIRVVPLGVDDEWFTQPSQSSIDALCRARGVRRGCFFSVGTLQPRKNLGGLIAAYDRLPNAVRKAHQLVIAGRYGWSAEGLRADLESRRSSGDVVWLDYVSTDDLRALFAMSRAFVFPTLAEGFGLPMLEAFASGTPVIASDIAALREVGAKHVRYVTPGDIDQLGEAMERVANAAPDANQLEQARNRAHQFSWSATARQTLAAYVELDGARRQRPVVAE